MYKIIDGRSTGKTSRLLLLAKENNGIVVCSNPFALKEKAYAYGIVGIDFISYSEYLANPKFTNRPIFIDEIELFLRRMDGKIMGYTLSNEELSYES